LAICYLLGWFLSFIFRVTTFCLTGLTIGPYVYISKNVHGMYYGSPTLHRVGLNFVCLFSTHLSINVLRFLKLHYFIAVTPNFTFEFCNSPLLFCYIIVMKINPVSLAVKAAWLDRRDGVHTRPPINNKNNQVWSRCKSRKSQQVVCWVGVCFDGKRLLDFVEERAKINAIYYINELLPNFGGKLS